MLYYSRDTRGLIPLPIKPFNLVLSKTILLYLYTLPLHLLLLIPALVIYGLPQPFSLEYALAAVVQLLLGSTVPLALAVLLVFILTKLVNLSRYRVAIELSGMVMLLFRFVSSITIDLKRPLLSWTHPQQAVKQNMNVLFSVGISFGFTGLLDLIFVPRVLAYADRRYGGGLQL